jgi:8-oxo-dGTP diphosphatase
VKVFEFLGAMTYRARGRPKVVQFWRMQAYQRPSRDIMKDIVAVEWLTLAAAVRRLSYPLEKLFLHHVGRRILRRRRRKLARRKAVRRRPTKKTRHRKSAKRRR